MVGTGGKSSRRRSWESLTPAYRRRLEAKSITRGSYESGASLAGARGHSKTPERPARADRRPEYAAYRARRSDEMRVITTVGVQVLSGMTSADRSIVGAHDNLVGWYLRNGRTGSLLPSFAGTQVTGYTQDDKYETALTVTLETDFAKLGDMERAGELDFRSVYVKAA